MPNVSNTDVVNKNVIIATSVGLTSPYFFFVNVKNEAPINVKRQHLTTIVVVPIAYLKKLTEVALPRK
jgi:hypothetical protein